MSTNARRLKVLMHGGIDGSAGNRLTSPLPIFGGPPMPRRRDPAKAVAMLDLLA